MAGEIKSYISPINFKVNPAKDVGYHESLISSNRMVSIENYLSDTVISEEVILKLISSKDKKTQALECLEKHLNENQGIFMIHDKQSLFNGFVTILAESNDKTKIFCTKLLIKIIPQLGSNVDKYMTKVVNQVINNVGSQTISLKKESVLTLHLYMKHSADVDPIFRAIALEGINHKVSKKRKEIILTFPTLLLPEFKNEDFFDIIHHLVINLTEDIVEHELVINVLKKVCDVIGNKAFDECIRRLSAPMQQCYFHCISKHNETYVESSVPSLFSSSSKKNSTFYDITKSHANQSPVADDNSYDIGVFVSQKSHSENVHPFVSIDSLSSTQNSNNRSDNSQLSFISKELIGDLSNSDHTIRLKALSSLDGVLSSLQKPTLVVNNVLTLTSLLQSSILDRNYRVSCAALQVLNKLVLMLGSELNRYTKVFVNAVSKKIGNSKDMVRSDYYKVLLNIMNVVGHQKVLDLLFEKLDCKQSKVKEDCICFIIVTLLTLKSRSNNDLNFGKICRNVTNCLTDSQPVVRRASLECVAVLGHILGSTNKEILSAVDKVELHHENATGIMAAVQARLLKEQLPKLKENMLVEYADFPATAASVGSIHGADIQWIAAVEKPKKSTFSNVYDQSNKSFSASSTKNTNYNSTNFSQGRRLPSAGKQGSFPWTKSSVPPFQPKNIWGSETEVPPSSVNVHNSLQRNKHIGDEGPSYVELHNRKKEALSSKLSNDASSSKNSGYQPSFATNQCGNPGGSAVTSLALSSSCPTSFFEKNSAVRPRRIKPQTSPNDPSPRSSVSPDEDVSPIRLKPALARSASKRRDNSASNSRELLRVDSSPSNTPIKLKSASASPRIDRMLFSTPTEQMRPMLASHSHSSNNGAAERFSGPSIDLLMEDASPSPSPVGYTPSSLQRKTPTLYKPESHHLDKDSTRSDPLFDPTPSDTRRDPPSPRPIVSSHFSPSRHRQSEELPENAFNSIRRSAQNKRERMKIQDDSFNGSFTQYAREPNKASSDLIDDAASSFPNNDSSPAQTPIGDLPLLKYSPNTGKTFETRKVDSDVSVIGVGYPTQSSFLSSSNTADSKLSHLHSASVTPTAVSSTPVLPNKFSPVPAATDRSKAHRASMQSFVRSDSPELINRSFNIQGRGVFMTSPSTPPSSGSEVESSTSREGKPDTDHLIDGICGVAVKQSGYIPDDFSLGQKPSIGSISLSASLKEQKERKEKRKETLLRKDTQQLSKTLTYGEDLDRNSTYLNDDDSSDVDRDRSRDFGTRSLKSTSRSSTLNGTTSKPGSSHSVSLIPLENPEKSLSDTIAALTTADSEDWEVMTQGMYTIRRLATHHRVVLASRFYDVIALLNKYVPSLRSQVSKSTVQAITDLYTNLEKPVVDTSLDTTIRTLLIEHGKPMSFIKQESSKSLQAIVKVASTGKTLNAFLNTGLRHRNKNVRNTAAKCCVELVDRMGPGKALSGVKDTTDRLLNALVSFTADKSEVVRYHGRRIVNSLMNHEDFNQSLDRYLSSDDALTIKNVASSIRQRGLAPPSSLGLKRSEKSGRKKVASPASVVVGRVQASTTPPGRVKGLKTFTEQQDQEKLKALCYDLSEGDISEKKSAVSTLLQKINRDRRFVEENVVKIMSSYITLLNTAQTKLNSIGLEHLPDLITSLSPHFRDITPQLVPALIKLTTSKQHSALSLHCIDLLVKHVDHLWIIQPFATSAMYCGNAKAKQIAINTVTKLIERVARRKISVIERQVLPVLWQLLSAQNAPSVVQLRRDVEQLACVLHRVLGRRLLECAEAQNLTAKVKRILEA